MIKNIADVSFDYKIKAEEPISTNSENLNWKIPIHISLTANKNFYSIPKYLNEILKSLSLTNEGVKNYLLLEKKVYPITFLGLTEFDNSYVILRKEESILKLLELIYYISNHSIFNFKINNGVEEWKINDKVMKYFKSDYRGGLGDLRKVGINVVIGNIPRNVQGEENFYSKYLFKYDLSNFKLIGALGLNNDIPFILMGNSLNFSFWDHQLSDLSELIEFENGERWGGDINRITENTILYPENYNKKLTKTENPYFNKTFKHLNELKKNTIKNNFGLILNFKYIDIEKDLVKYDYIDVRSLDELKKITEYKVFSIGN